MDLLRILFIGNSFAVDTMEYAAEISHALGIKKVKFGVLYEGGCSIDMHYEYAVTERPAYVYYTNDGSGWKSTDAFKTVDALKSEAWDVVAIQHGSRGTSRYTSPECYGRLGDLVDFIKPFLPVDTKIAFNLTWLGEPSHPHHEILSYGADVLRMRKRLEEVTEAVILSNPKIDLLVPTGTAIENARTSAIGILTRDGYHLSYDKGRYIAALAFISTVTGIDAAECAWAPEGVDEYARAVALESVKNAQKNPLSVTKSTFE
jgi:hypothetical protein